VNVIILNSWFIEELENTKWVIRIRKSKKNRQHNGQKKKDKMINSTHTSLSPIRREFEPGFVNYKKRCTRLAIASDKVYQLLAHGRWFSPGTLSSSTTKTGPMPGADPGFQVRGRGQLKKLRRAKGGAKLFGVFLVKNHDFTPIFFFFPNFRESLNSDSQQFYQY
jgi:hypothetical protein